MIKSLHYLTPKIGYMLNPCDVIHASEYRKQPNPERLNLINGIYTRLRMGEYIPSE